MRVVQHTSSLPRPRQSVAAMCALTTARAMWQRISRYGVTMPGSVFEIMVPLLLCYTILAANGETFQDPLYCIKAFTRSAVLVYTIFNRTHSRRAHPKVAARPWAHDRG